MLFDIVSLEEILTHLAGFASIGILGILLSDIKVVSK